MFGRVALLAAGGTLVASLCHAQEPCEAAAGTRIDRVYVEFNYVSGLPLEGDRLVGDLGGQDGLRVGIVRGADGRWFADLASQAALLPGDLTFAQLDASFRPYRVGWTFVRRPGATVAPESGSDAGRCVAHFAFDSLPVWRVGIEALPDDTLPVSCQACAAGAETAFVTRAVPLTEGIRMEVDLGGRCSYTLDINPGDELPVTIPRNEITQALLTRCETDLWDIITRFRRLRIPSGGIRIRNAVDEATVP